MSLQVNTEGQVRDARCVPSTPGINNTSPVSSPQRHGRSILVGLVPITMLVVIQWVMFMAIWIRNLVLNHKYDGWKEAGSSSSMPKDVTYPPIRVGDGESYAGAQLVLWLLPLGYDTVLLPGLLVCTWGQRSCSVFLLCVSMFSFLMWTVCGCFNVLAHAVGWESRRDVMFDGLFGAIAAFQIMLGVLWLLVMIAGAKRVDKEKKEKWLGKRVEGEVRRRLEVYRMQELPAYQA